jgi:ribosomal protein S18 acetylase RimI-like enzyme
MAETQVHIRRCTSRDIDCILELDRQWEQEGIAFEFVPIRREDFVATLERFPAYFLVAEVEGAVVGYVNGSVRSGQDVAVVGEHERCLEIENIYVRADVRNRHIGSRLLDRLLGAAEQDGVHRFLVTTVTKDMDRILDFYRGHGFRPWSLQLFR